MANAVCEPGPSGWKTLRLAHLFVIAGLSVAALATAPDQARSQDAAIRLAQQRYIVPQRPKPEPAPPPVAPVDSTSALGQALVACDKEATTHLRSSGPEERSYARSLLQGTRASGLCLQRAHRRGEVPHRLLYQNRRCQIS